MQRFKGWLTSPLHNWSLPWRQMDLPTFAIFRFGFFLFSWLLFCGRLFKCVGKWQVMNITKTLIDILIFCGEPFFLMPFNYYR